MTDHAAIRLEEKVAYLELRVADLEAALARETTTTLDLSERVRLLERALQVLATRQTAPAGEVQGAFTDDDPVPHSG